MIKESKHWGHMLFTAPHKGRGKLVALGAMRYLDFSKYILLSCTGSEFSGSGWLLWVTLVTAAAS